MESNFIITTTNNIENGIIMRYIDTICTNVVIGTNIFSDFAASFTDFFGGRSNAYQQKLELIYQEATEKLKRKAIQIGANAIIGFRVDFDEISGKDKSMFMVSVSGTACFVKYSNTGTLQTPTKDIIISNRELKKEIKKIEIINTIKKGEGIGEKEIEFLVENPQEEIIEDLLNRYISYYNRNDSQEKAKNIIYILNAYPTETLIPFIYKKYETTKDTSIQQFIKQYNLFDAKHILSICDKDMQLAITLLSCDRESYSEEEILLMEKILQRIEQMPDLGKIETVKSGMFGKEQEKYICPNGHKNNIDSQYCENTGCGQNIKGLTYQQVSNITKFREKINILKRLTNK